MAVLSLKESCIRRLIKYERKENADILWNVLPKIYINILMTRLYKGTSSIAVYTPQNIYRSPNMLTLIRAYPKTFLDTNMFQQTLFKTATAGDSCFILNMLLLIFIRAYPETFLDHNMFQQILLKAATAGDTNCVLDMLQNAPYQAHPETMKKILKQSQRRYNKRNQKEIHRLTKLWLNTYAGPQPARRWVDPNDIAEFDLHDQYT